MGYHVGTMPVVLIAKAAPKPLLTVLVPFIPAPPTSTIIPAMCFIIVRRCGLAFSVASRQAKSSSRPSSGHLSPSWL